MNFYLNLAYFFFTTIHIFIYNLNKVSIEVVAVVIIVKLIKLLK